MPNLKDLKNRISSVSATKKITSAMKMVAASKFRRAREQAESSFEYSSRLSKVVSNAIRYLDYNKNKLIEGNGSDKRHLLVVISTDRGLCGGLNTNLFKSVRKHIELLVNQNKEFKIVCIGKKAKDFLQVNYKKQILFELSSNSKDIDYDFSENFIKKIINLFVNNEFDVCNLFYNKFISAISQKTENMQLLPFAINSSEEAGEENVFESEPNPDYLISELIPLNLTMQFYNSILQNTASEHGARMSAMDNATRNASEMIKSLTLQYNRARQAVITKELIEIISGAEAV